MKVPTPFDLDLTVRSHGFYDLPPWRYDRERRLLGRPFLLPSGRAVDVEVTPADGGLAIRIAAEGRLSAAEARVATDAMRRCLALDEDLGPFHARIRELAAARPPATLPALAWAAARGAGRLLRSPTVFEDAVKTLCTTNCSWSLTRTMTSNLVERLGATAPGARRCFPTAGAMAEQPERFYRETVRAGYRAPFLRALADEVASGLLDIESWRSSPLPTDELARAIGALPGFGPYATEHLLKLLGRYEHLALDSWMRGKIARLRGRRRPPGDGTLQRRYRPYGHWAGLALWLELTADWHQGEPTWPPPV